MTASGLFGPLFPPITISSSSMVSKLSISRIAGLMMGMWFLSSSLAGYVSGVIAGIMSVPKETGSENPHEISLMIYTQNFESLAVMAFAVAIVLFLLSPIIKKYIKI